MNVFVFRELIMTTVGQDIENISYVGTRFYIDSVNGTKHFNITAWIGVCQMFFMVVR